MDALDDLRYYDLEYIKFAPYDVTHLCRIANKKCTITSKMILIMMSGCEVS